MIKSMTGFGKTIAEISGKRIIIEIRSLNSKQLDINTKVPQLFREKEGEIRQLISQYLERGKIEVVFSFDSISEGPDYNISVPIAQKYYNSIKDLSESLGIPVGSDILPILITLPDVLKSGNKELNDNDWQIIKRGLDRTIELTNEFRKHEGEVLERELQQRINNILLLLKQVEPLEKARIVALREQFLKNQQDFFQGSPSEKFDQNRFEQELFWYIEKLDITEEKVRLAKHCNYFIETMSSSESNGRKLGFITQEIGREINTLGAKAYDADIQKIVVDMKDELEKVKEQLGNVL